MCNTLIANKWYPNKESKLNKEPSTHKKFNTGHWIRSTSIITSLKRPMGLTDFYLLHILFGFWNRIFPQFHRLCENHRNSLIFYAHKISFSMIYFCCTKKVVRILIAFPGETQKKFREKLWFRYEKRDLQREKKEWWWVWQYGLWSFQMGHTKLETFLTKK